MRLLILLLILTFAACKQTIPLADAHCDFVQPSEIDKFFTSVFPLRGLEYSKAEGSARKHFDIGKCLEHPENFTPYMWTRRDEQFQNLRVYLLFAGSNGLVSKDVILVTDIHDKITEIRIYSWGR